MCAAAVAGFQKPLLNKFWKTNCITGFMIRYQTLSISYHRFKWLMKWVQPNNQRNQLRDCWRREAQLRRMKKDKHWRWSRISQESVIKKLLWSPFFLSKYMCSERGLAVMHASSVVLFIIWIQLHVNRSKIGRSWTHNFKHKNSVSLTIQHLTAPMKRYRSQSRHKSLPMS